MEVEEEMSRRLVAAEARHRAEVRRLRAEGAAALASRQASLQMTAADAASAAAVAAARAAELEERVSASQLSTSQKAGPPHPPHMRGRHMDVMTPI